MQIARLGITLGLLALVAGFAANAAEKKAAKPKWKGSIKVAGKKSDEELAKLAKVGKEDAQKTALAAVKAKDGNKSVTEGGLEVENGYLIYSFDIKVKGKKGIQEIVVDAGTGKVLGQEHESDAAEAKEKKEEAKEKKSEAKEKPKKESK